MGKSVLLNFCGPDPMRFDKSNLKEMAFNEKIVIE